MTFVCHLRSSSRYLHSSANLGCAVRRGPLVFAGWYPRDHRPGEYPTTEEERKAAAVRYGMRVEDYQPIDPDDYNRHAGDYPDLGTITYDHKDPYESWTDRHHRRNWGELVQIDMMRYRGDRSTFTGLELDDFEWKRFFFKCARLLIPMFLISYWASRPHPNMLRWREPTMPKQYSHDYYRAWPWNDPLKYPIKNYTFEPLD